MQRAEALLEIMSAATATTESTTGYQDGRLRGTRHWRATCGENRMRRSAGGRRKRTRTCGHLAGDLPSGHR